MTRPQGYDSMPLEEEKAFWRANPLNGEVTIKVPGLPEFTMMNRNDDTVVKELYWIDYTGWEATSLRLWAALAARASGIPLDIGAYSGIHSILAAMVNPGWSYLPWRYNRIASSGSPRTRAGMV